MDRHFALAIDRRWLSESVENYKRFQQGMFPLGVDIDGLAEGSRVYLKVRRADRKLAIEDVSVAKMKESFFIKSQALCDWVQSLVGAETILIFFETSSNLARCVVTSAPAELWESMVTLDPPLRPSVYDLPPTSITKIDSEEIHAAVYGLVSGGDAELFGTTVQQFLTSPHIIVPLFAHVLSLSSKDNIDFPLLLRTTAEQIRSLLIDPSLGPVRIKRIRRDHARLWKEMLGERIAFADGGMARISGVPSAEPLALRVGIYCVIPGETDLTVREDWELTPYVMGDIVRRVDDTEEPPDGKRLQEASRYVLEPLTALRYLETHQGVRFLFLHGPLVNQFTQYDEGEPSYLPCLVPEFLQQFGLNQAAVTEALTGVPETRRHTSLWNQFMAIYGVLMKRIFSSEIPIAGVVERTAGRWLAQAVLGQMVAERRMTEALSKRMMSIIERYQISDDFLFGCVLEEGEYLEPLHISKNAERRARDQWKEVVRQYPSPFATVLKTSSTSFPYRVEMNPAAVKDSEQLLRLLYHTSRLLPRYAFPVGLDIVDKYAKVPDWLSRGVSARITADVLRRALNTGDPKIVAQVRQFLARTPRDFFYRPQT